MANEDVLVSFRAEDQLTAVIRNLQSEFKQFNKQLEGLSDNFKSSFNQQASAVKTSQQQIKNEVEKTKSSFIDLRRVIETAVGVGLYNVFQQGVGAIKDFASSALTMAGTLEQTRSAFNVLLGGAEQAKSMLQDLSDYAKKTPFELPQLQDMAKRLTAVGFAGDQVLPTLDILGNISAAVGTQKLPLLTLALGQVYTAGKLTGAELRQFSENGVPLLEELAKSFGVTTAEMKKMISDGKVGFKDVYKVLNDLTSEGGRLSGLMEAQSKTFSGVMSNIQDQIGVVARTFMGITEQGEIIAGGFFDRIKGAAESLMVVLSNLGYLLNGQINFEQFLQLSGVSDQIIQSMMWLGQAIQWVGQTIVSNLSDPLNQAFILGAIVAQVIFGMVIPAFTAVKTAILGIPQALGLLFSPIGLVIGAVALLFMAWQTNFMGIQQTTQQVLQWVGGKFGEFGQFMLTNLDGITDGIFNFVNGGISGLNGFINFLARNFGPMLADITGFAGWAFKGLSEIIGNVAGGITEAIGRLMQWILPFVTPILKTLVNTFGNIFKNIMLVVTGATKFISGIFSGDWKKMIDGAIDLWAGMAGGIASILDGVINVFRKGIANLFTLIEGALNNEMIKKGAEAIGLGDAVKTVKKMKDELSTDITPLQDYVKTMAKLGKQGLGIDPTASQEEQNKNNKAVDDVINNVLNSIDGMADKFSKIDFSAVNASIKNGYKTVGSTVDQMAQQAKAMLQNLAKNPPEIAKLGEAQKTAIKNLIQSIGQGMSSFGQSLSQVQTGKIEMPDFQKMLAGLQGQFGQLKQFTPEGQQDIMGKVAEMRKKALEDFMKMGSPLGKDKSGSGKSKKSEAEKELDKQAELLRLQERQLQLEKENIKAQQEMALRPLLQELEDKKRVDGADTTDLQGRITELKRQQQNQLDQLEAKQRQLNQQQFDLDVKRAGATDQFGSSTNITSGGTLNLNGDISINNTADLNSFANLLKSALV